jgi:hypothetical protein
VWFRLSSEVSTGRLWTINSLNGLHCSARTAVVWHGRSAERLRAHFDAVALPLALSEAQVRRRQTANYSETANRGNFRRRTFFLCTPLRRAWVAGGGLGFAAVARCAEHW